MEEIKAGYENVRLQDGDGNKITSTGGALNISGSISFAEEAIAADGGALPAKAKVIAGYDGAAVQVLKTDASGELQIDVLSSALPSNAATLTAQTDGSHKSQIVDAAGDIADVKLLSVNLTGTDKGLVTNTIIHGEATGGGGGYVDVKVTPSGALTTESILAGLDAAVLGQDTMANSLSVVLASNQSAISVTDNGGSLTIDGSVSVGSSALPAGAATETTLQSVDGHLFKLDGAIVLDKASYAIGGNRVVVGGYVFDDVADAPALSENTAAAGRININRAQVGVIEDASTRGRYVTVTASNALKIDGSAVTQPVSGTVGVSGSVAVTGPLTDAELRATAVPVSAASLPLPAGAATETTLSAVNTKLPAALGQTTMSGSLAVTIASNQTSIPVTGSLSSVKLSVVDLLDANILDASSTNIPGSASSPVQVVASTASAIQALQLLDTTGAFIGVYTGAAASEVLKLVMGPGSDQTIEHAIPAGTRISLKRLDSTSAVSTGIVAINFLG